MQCLFLALVAALLIILGAFGIFTAETTSFRAIMTEAHASDVRAPVDAYGLGPDESAMTEIPGLPY